MLYGAHRGALGSQSIFKCGHGTAKNSVVVMEFVSDEYGAKALTGAAERMQIPDGVTGFKYAMDWFWREVKNG